MVSGGRKSRMARLLAWSALKVYYEVQVQFNKPPGLDQRLRIQRFRCGVQGFEAQ